jgi:hypothetical protein
VTKSVLDLRVAVAQARRAPRPLSLNLSKALIVGEDLLGRWEYVAGTCGRVWTAAQCRKITRDIRAAMREPEVLA